MGLIRRKWTRITQISTSLNRTTLHMSNYPNSCLLMTIILITTTIIIITILYLLLLLHLFSVECLFGSHSIRVDCICSRVNNDLHRLSLEQLSLDFLLPNGAQNEVGNLVVHLHVEQITVLN